MKSSGGFRKIRVAAWLLIATSVAVPAVLLPALAWFGESPQQSFEDIVGWANILALSVGAIGVVVLIADKIGALGAQDSDTLAASVRSIGSSAERQDFELLSQLLRTDMPEIRSADCRFAVSGGRSRKRRPTTDSRKAAKPFSRIGEHYMTSARRRLVVYGPPGSGKTVLALTLLTQLFEKLRATGGVVEGVDTPVPILLSAANWNPRQESVAGLLSAGLIARFRVGEKLAKQIVESGRVFPVIDGLDEMDEPGSSEVGNAIAAVLAINAYVASTPQAHLVITCRTGTPQMEQAARSLRSVESITIESITPTGIAGYLEEQCVSQAQLTAWAPVLDSIRTPQGRRLAKALSTPWRLSAAAIFVIEGADPLSLLPTEQEKSARGSAYDNRVRNILMGSFVRTRIETGLVAMKSTPSVIKCLTTLSIIGSRDQVAAPQIAVERWWQHFGRKAVVVQAIAAWFVMHLPFAVYGNFPLPYPESETPTLTFVAIMTNYGTIMFLCTSYAVRRKRTYTFRFRVLRSPAKIAGVCFVGVLGGTVVGGSAWLLTGPIFGIAFGVLGLIYVVLRFAAEPAQTAETVGPRTSIRDDARVSFILGSVLGLYFGLYYFQIYGLYIALVLGTMVGFAVPMSSMYLRYVAAVYLGATRHDLPYRFSKFLDDCVTLGILRISGNTYEFKHREISEYLVSTNSRR